MAARVIEVKFPLKPEKQEFGVKDEIITMKIYFLHIRIYELKLYYA